MSALNYKIADGLNRARRYFYWVPPLVWSGVLLFWSGRAGSATTSVSWLSIIVPVGWSPETFETVHFLVRKAAHVAGYGLLAYLTFRAARGPQRGFERQWAFVAVVYALGVACLDELLQSSVSVRTGTPHDVVIDLIGALLVIVVIRLKSGVLFSSQ